MKSITRASEEAPYSRSKHGSFNDGYQPVATKSRWLRSCCWLLIGFGVLLLLLFFICLILWLVLKPAYPILVMDDINVSSIKVAQKLGVTDGVKILLSFNMTANFTVMNPNHVKLSYDPSLVNVSYGGLFLGNSTVPSFEEAAKSNKTLQGILVVDKVNVLEANGLALLKDASQNAIPLTVIAQIHAHVHAVGLTSPTIQVKVTCNIVVNPQGRKLNSKHCVVSTLKL